MSSEKPRTPAETNAGKAVPFLLKPRPTPIVTMGAPVETPAKTSDASAPVPARRFDDQVHGWNPQLHLWRRSAKE